MKWGGFLGKGGGRVNTKWGELHEMGRFLVKWGGLGLG